MSEEKTLIFDIEKFALHDGPGIRTVVFMKGCPLRCLWCHNPESQSFKKEFLFNQEKCTSCGRCAVVCPQGCHVFNGSEHLFDREKCLYCGKCTESCPAEALQLCGKEMSVKEVMDEVLKDKVFYENSGGGITLSGGEPLAHYSFSYALLEAANNAQLHTAVETSGFASWEQIERLLPLVDLWLWDVKAAPGKHEDLTGVPHEKIYENLKRLSERNAPIVLRCPLIPQVNDEDAHLKQIAELANELSSVQRIDLEPYHPMGEGKSLDLGRSDVFRSGFASDADKNRWKEVISAHTKVPLHIF